MTIHTDDYEQFEAWSRSRPNIILVNRTVNPHPMPAGLSPELIERLNGARPDFLVASREELDRLGIVLAHDLLTRFLKGEPVLLIAGRVDFREPLKRGRRQKEELERQVQDALAVQVYVGIERLCAWFQARDRRRLTLTIPERRDRAIELLAREAWLDDPRTPVSANDDDRQAFFRTQFDAGGRLVSSWYPWTTRPDDLSRVARRIVETSSQGMDHGLIAEMIDREVNMTRFMLRCLRQATELVLIAHEMTAEIHKHANMTRGQQAVLAGAAIDRPTLFEATRAALDGDFNPADLFRNLLSYHDMLELACLVGRNGRGHDVRLDAGLAKELQVVIDIRDRFDATPPVPGECPHDTQAAALVITSAAYELFSRETWLPVLNEAVAGGADIMLSGTMSVRRG